MHLGFEFPPHIGEMDRVGWHGFRFTFSVGSLSAMLRRTRSLFESADKIRDRLRAEDERMVQNAEMPAPQTPRDALRGIGLGDGATQRCAP